ncbi:MAG: alkene reductase [Gemmatimonadota bacterium]|jgi:N-ethylmaleimide reductase
MPDSISLFDSFSLGPLQLPNRAVMAPLTRSRAIGGVPNELMARYYGQRAGAGLIVSEGTAPAPEGIGYPRIPGIFSDEQEAGWRGIARTVHDRGGRIFMQLMHTGRVSHPANLPEGAEVLAPSAVALEETGMWVDESGAEEPIPAPREMTDAEVRAAVAGYARAAKRAVAAGFDGVEIHGANGYLIQQFLNPHTNRRTDRWGGSWQARTRFALEVAGAVADAVGGERVGIRLSPYGVFNEMPLYDDIEETYRHLARRLGELGLVYLHLVDHSSMGAPDVPTGVRRAIRRAFPGALVLSGGYDLERANADLAAGEGDLVAFGRPFLANPDLVERFRRGAELNDPRPELFYTPGPEGYVDYPSLAG